MLLVVKTCAVFDCFSFPAFAAFIQGGGERRFKVFFAFDIVKVFQVVPLYFLTECLKITGKNVQISRALNFFSKPIRKINIVRS